MSFALRWFVMAPLTLAAIYIALSNPLDVVVSLDPFRPEDPAYGLRLPLYAVIFLSVLLGICIGGIAAGRLRRSASVSDENERLSSKRIG